MSRRLGLVGLLAFAVGCADIFGLSDYVAGTDDGGDEGVTPADGGADVMVGTDAGSDVGCAAPEVCTDGVDNNCNGLTDCEDPACAAGYTCDPALPGGWAPVGYDQAFRPPCAAGYGTPTDVEEGLSAGAATCRCTCGLTAPTSCAPVTVTAGTGGSNGCNNVTSQSETGSAGCQTLSSSISTTSEKMSAEGIPGGGGCSADAGVVTPSATATNQGRLCELATTTGSGCDGGGACASRPAPFAACVRQAGIVNCPSGYPVQHIVGTTVSDGRGCTPCSCGYDAGTCSGTMTFYGGPACNQASQVITAGGSCQAVPDQTWKSYKYAPVLSGAACSASAVAPMGNAGFADPATLCCTN